MKFTQKDIEYMINESIKKILSEGKFVIDNFDNGIDKGRLATVHPNVDAKMILYSNVNTAGY